MRAADLRCLSAPVGPVADRGRHIVLPTHLIPRGTTAPPATASHGESQDVRV